MIDISTRIIHSFDTVDNWNTVNPLIKKGEIIFKEKSNGKVVLAVGNVDGGVNAADAPVVYDEDEINEKLNNLNQAVLDAETYAEEAEQQAELAKNYAESVGIRLQIFTSLEQIGITPGEETFATIHNALPVNSVLAYYSYPNNSFNDSFYPVENYYGVLEAFKLNKTKTIFKFYSHQSPNNNELSELYLSAFDSGYTDTRTSVWNKCINSQSSNTQGLNSRLDFNNTSNEAIRLNNISSNLTRDIAGYDADGSKIGLLRFGKYDNGATNGVKLAVANASNTSPDFLSLYLNETTGNCFTRLYQNVIMQNGEIFLGSSSDNNCRFGYKFVQSGEEVANLPQGTYFFFGTAGTNDSDTQLKGTDFQGFSMRQSGQAMQIVCSGNKVLFRYDDSNTAGTNPQYSAWKQFTLTNA